jgi:hypothetical protein
VLDLGNAKLEIVPLVARDEAELLQRAAEGRTGTLAHAHRISAPAVRRLVDPGARVFLAHPAALRERLGQLVGSLGRQRDRAELDELELRVAQIEHRLRLLEGPRAVPSPPK